jgi:hypothetical protein
MARRLPISESGRWSEFRPKVSWLQTTRMRSRRSRKSRSAERSEGSLDARHRFRTISIRSVEHQSSKARGAFRQERCLKFLANEHRYESIETVRPPDHRMRIVSDGYKPILRSGCKASGWTLDSPTEQGFPGTGAMPNSRGNLRLRSV